MRTSLPVMNAPSGPMRSAATVATSSRGAAAPHRGQLEHAPVPRAARAGQLVLREWGVDDAGADRVEPRAALAPPDGLGHHPQRVATLGQLVGMEAVGHLVGPSMGSASNSSAGVVASAASCSAVRAPRRCPDCEAMTTPAPPPAITFPNSSSSTAVPYRSTARIAAGDAWLGESPAAWMTPVMSPNPVAVSTIACSDSREDTSTVAVLTSN